MCELRIYENKDGSKYTFDGKHLRLYSAMYHLFAKINTEDTKSLKEFLNNIEEI